MSLKKQRSEIRQQLLDDQTAEGGSALAVPGVDMSNLKQRMSKVHEDLQKLQIEEEKKNSSTKLQESMNKSQYCLEKILTPKHIFYTYGVLDIICLVGLLIYSIALKKSSVILLIVFYVPNNLLMLFVLIWDTPALRHWYQVWLRTKLIIQGFYLPIVLFRYDQTKWESLYCSQYLPSYDMNWNSMQKYIESEDFTLLHSLDNGLPQESNSLNIQSLKGDEDDEEDQKNKEKEQEDEKDTKKSKNGAPQIPLSEEEIKKRYIQICATSVVLTSMMVFVFYQIISGHQYFTARGYSNEAAEAVKAKNVFQLKLASDLANMMKGDPNFLLRELEKAEKSLARQVRQEAQNDEDEAQDQKLGQEKTVHTAINQSSVVD